MDRLLADLRPGQRAERYRQFAAEAVSKAQVTFDPDLRAEYLTVAAGWHAMAVEAERYVAPLLSEDDTSGQSKIAPNHLP